MLDDLFAPLDDSPHASELMGGLIVAEVAVSSAHLDALAEMAADPDFVRASEILFVDENDDGTVVFSNARHFADLMQRVTLPTEADVIAWQAELLEQVWARYADKVSRARELG